MKSKINFLFLLVIVSSLALASAAKAYEEENIPIPSGLIGSSGNRAIMVRWDIIKDPKIIGFNVYRKTISRRKRARRTYKKITPKPVRSNIFFDTALENGKIYYYSVKSIYSNGKESGFANRIHIKAGQGAIHLDFDILASTILPGIAGPYIVDTMILVERSASLTIEQGAKLIFAEGSGLHIRGSIKATGASFTSDKSVMWQGIRVESSKKGSFVTGSIIENAKIGIDLYSSALSVTENVLKNNDAAIKVGSASSPDISKNKIINNKRYGIHLIGGSSAAKNPVPAIYNNEIFGNSLYNVYTENFPDNAKTVIEATSNWWGTYDAEKIIASIYDYVDNPRSSPTVSFNGFLTSPDGPADKQLYLYGSVCAGTTLLPEEYMVIGDLTVCPDAELNIPPNAKLKMADGVLITVLGRLSAIGREDSPVTFTSLSDRPAPGSWKGIFFKGHNAGSELAYSYIEYAQTAIKLYRSSPDIKRNKISNNMTGIELLKGSSPAIANNNIIGNKRDGIHMEGDGLAVNNPMPTITYNYIYSNGRYNIYSMWYGKPEKTVINARKNNWDLFTSEKIEKTLYDNRDNSDAPKIDFSEYW